MKEEQEQENSPPAAWFFWILLCATLSLTFPDPSALSSEKVTAAGF